MRFASKTMKNLNIYFANKVMMSISLQCRYQVFKSERHYCHIKIKFVCFEENFVANVHQTNYNDRTSN